MKNNRLLFVLSLSALLISGCANVSQTPYELEVEGNFQADRVKEASKVLAYENDFSVDKGYIDPDHSWSRNNNSVTTGGGGVAGAAATYYANNTNDVYLSNGELILRESANYHYVETMAILPDLSTMEGWNNNYIVTVNARFLDYNNFNFNSNLGTTGFNILHRLDPTTGGCVFSKIMFPKYNAAQTYTYEAYGRVSSGTNRGQISGKLASETLGDIDLSANHRFIVMVDGTGAATTLTGYVDGKAFDFGVTAKTYFANHALGKRIALSVANASVAVSSVKVTSIDAKTVFYENDFTNYDHSNIWDGWSTYGECASSCTDGYHDIKDGKLNLYSWMENYESFKHQILFAPGLYENFQMSFDFTVNKSFEPEDGIFDKYFGLVFSGSPDLDADAGKYGVFHLRKNGKIDLYAHQTVDARNWVGIKTSIRAADVDPITYGKSYHVVLSIEDGTVNFRLTGSGINRVSYTQNFRGYKISPVPFKSGRVGFMANSTDVSIDNLSIYEIK